MGGGKGGVWVGVDIFVYEGDGGYEGEEGEEAEEGEEGLDFGSEGWKRGDANPVTADNRIKRWYEATTSFEA